MYPFPPLHYLILPARGRSRTRSGAVPQVAEREGDIDWSRAGRGAVRYGWQPGRTVASAGAEAGWEVGSGSQKP